ncbi:MAG: cyclodeaminase/cyclohydrolase family protein [Bacillota bacterium]
MKSFAEYNLDTFASKLASDSPTPGGGSVAGLSASLSASLIEMVINLTKDDSLDEYNIELQKKRKEALELIDKDAESFNKVMEAYKMPKNSEEERNKRKKAIQNGLYEASLTPLDTMKLALKLLELARKVIEKGNPHAISDIGVASLMGISAIKGAYLNVLINTQSLKDEEKALELEKEAKNIIEKGEKLNSEIENITIKKIKNK